MDIKTFDFYLLPKVCKDRFIELLKPFSLRKLALINHDFYELAVQQFNGRSEKLPVHKKLILKINSESLEIVEGENVIPKDLKNEMPSILACLEPYFPCKILNISGATEAINISELCDNILTYFNFVAITLRELHLASLSLNAATLIDTLLSAPAITTISLKDVSLQSTVNFNSLLSKLPSLKSLSIINVSSVKYEPDSLSALLVHSILKSKLEVIKIDPYIGIPDEEDFEALLRTVTKELEIVWIGNVTEGNRCPEDIHEVCVDPYYKVRLCRKKE